MLFTRSFVIIALEKTLEESVVVKARFVRLKKILFIVNQVVDIGKISVQVLVLAIVPSSQPSVTSAVLVVSDAVTVSLLEAVRVDAGYDVDHA